jgi:hypothetical protein
MRCSNKYFLFELSSEITYSSYSTILCIGGVMVSELASSAEDRGFEL